MPTRFAVLLVLPLVNGCAIGTYSVLDGSGPIRRSSDPDQAVYAEVGDGPGGALVLAKKMRASELLVLADGNTRRVKIPGGATDAQVVGTRIYTRSGDQVLRRSLERPSRKGRVVAELADLKGFRVSPTGDALLVSNGERVVERRDGTERVLFQGKALAMAWDPDREAVWIASRAPLAVVDCLRLSDLEVLHRVPLPLELETPSLQITLSGDTLMVHAHDRPIDAALWIAPELRRATTVGNLRSRGRGQAPQPRAPPTIPLAGIPAGERLNVLVAAPGAPMRFGQVAAYPGGRFLVADDRGSTSGPSLWVIEAHGSDGALPRTSRVKCPQAWPRAVQGLAADEAGVTVVAGPYLLRVTPGSGCTPDDPTKTAGDYARRTVNMLINLPLMALEAAVFLPLNGLASVAAMPFGFVFIADEPAAGLAILAAPVWFPVAMTFGLIQF